MKPRSAGRECVRMSALVAAIASFACGLAAPTTIASAEERAAFPHARHEGLFPTCRPCHEGAWSGSAPIHSASAEDCARCHDGVARPRVAWSPPVRPTPFYIFEHQRHVVDAEIACADCHQVPGAAGRMDVALPGVDRCLACHGEATVHLAAPSCAPCHQALTAIPGLSAERIAAFRAPPNHASADFLFEHGPLSERDPLRCSICHARETCESCHPNASTLAPIQSLAPDARVLAQAQRIEVRWPRPASHDDPAWAQAHGTRTESLASCGNCHTRQSCESCHRDELDALDALPQATGAGPTGVTVARARPSDHHAWFGEDHAAAASTAAPNCATCHAPSFCESCHDPDGIASPSTVRGSDSAHRSTFHPTNFLERHAAEAYGRDGDCATCHSTETFCRSCHAESGVSPTDSRTGAYHDSQPFWLLNHGQAARQGLESCASCHQQTDCLQCHSAKGGWRINPHGPDFDPNAFGDRNLHPCAVCHFADPRP
jgi:Cytochrome c7 and related cytochrome c